MKNNSELLNNLGNFINRFVVTSLNNVHHFFFRSLMFLKNNFDSTIPPMDLTTEDYSLIAMITRELKAYINSLESLK